MTTQTVLLDIFDYGASSVTVTLHDPDTLTLTDTADTVTQNGVNGCRYSAVFTRVSVLAGGVYAVGIEVNGIPGILYCTLAGTDGETVVARAERGAVTGSGGGGGGTTTIVTLQAAAGISPGVIVGPSEPLVIGDDYLTVMNRSVRINLLDANGDPAEVEYGTYALDDDGISIQMLLAKSGKPSVEALIVGTCTFFPAVGDVPPYLIVEFTKVETAKAIPGPYDMQVEAVWNDGKTVTFAPYGQIEFTRNIGRRT